MKYSNRKIALLGMCTSIALILAYVETLIPPILTSVPGIKLGLPNIAIVFVLYSYGVWEAAAVSGIRLLAVSMLFGTPITFAYSLAGAILSLVGMALLKRMNFLKTVVKFYDIFKCHLFNSSIPSQ